MTSTVTADAKAKRKPRGKAIRITSPESLLKVVPRLLGFQPSGSVVLIGTEPPRAQVRITLRYDLPDPGDAGLAAEIARHATAVFGAQHVKTVLAVGYGKDSAVTPVADAIREAASTTGIRVSELLRVEGKRYWSYLCTDERCCPPEGRPFEVDQDPVALTSATEETRVLASREELAATVAPAGAEAAEIMQRATRLAEEHAARLAIRAAGSGGSASPRRAIISAGLEAVGEAIESYRRGERMEAGNSAAWLTCVLRGLRVRDDAWARMEPKHREAHLRLWTDLVRLAQPGYVAAPAALLAFVAWQSGNGALANVALDRALRDDPYYSMAQLLRQAIDSGAPPSMARLPMTPEEVAASYDDFDREAEEDIDEQDKDEPEEDEEPDTVEEDSDQDDGSPSGLGGTQVS